MEVEHTNKSSHPEDANQGGDNEGGNWHRRLRLRKSSTSSLTVKSTTEEENVVTKPQKIPSQNKHQTHQVGSHSGSKLTFACSNCKDGAMFSPQDLLNHFSVFHGGTGEPPTFPCDWCTFATPEFAILQQHRMKHKQCRLMCEICNDDVLQTLPQLRKHCNTQHSLNGQYHCSKCNCSTKEFKNFVHHSCPANTESPLASTEKSGIKQTNGELNGNHLATADGAGQKEELLKPVSTECRQGWRRKNWWKKRERSINTPDLKALLSNPETQWPSSGFLPFSAAGLLDENCVFLNPARTLEETQQFLEKTVNSGKKWPVDIKGGSELTSQSCPGSLPLQSNIKQYSIPLPGFRNSEQNKLSSLMEKYNISVPPDCTTKVVGFKMVDGKKHLILKVIPKSAKSDVSPDAGKVSSGLSPAKFNSSGSGSPLERSSDLTCPELDGTTTKNALSCDATSSSSQSKKVSEKKQPVEAASQVDVSENVCNKGSGACTEIPSAPPQLAVSGTEGDLNVANQKNTEKLSMCTSGDNTPHLTEVVADVSVEISSLQEADIQTLHPDIQEIEHTDPPETATEDLPENCAKLTTSQNDSGCHGDLASCIPSDVDSLEEALQSQLSSLMSDEDGSCGRDSNNMHKKSMEDSPVTLSPLHLNEQEVGKIPSSSVSCSSTNKDTEAVSKPNTVHPTSVVSLQKHTPAPPFNSPGEDGALLFQDSGDEYTNSVDPRDAPVPLEQSCTTETVEEPNYLAMLSLGDSCHNPDLYQTLEELPVTTVCHLLDDPEVTSRGNTHQSNKLGRLSTQQVDLQPSKAIPVAAATEKSSPQSKVSLPEANDPAMKRKRQGEPTAKDSQQHISKSRKQLVENSQENDPPASVHYWEPVPQAAERTLRLLPVCSSQPIKVPRLNQPVIVLNHPDTDIPEVVNIMKVVHKHKGAVQKVVLSQGTLKALSELNGDTFRASCRPSHYRRAWPQETVRERFILKLKLKRLCGNKYKVAPSASKTDRYQSTFRCWFCGRLFKNQEAWVGHGQRHLMEATRDWNKLLNSEGQRNSPIQPYFH